MTGASAISSSRTACVTQGIDRERSIAVPKRISRPNATANERLPSDFCRRVGTVALRVVAFDRFCAARWANRVELFAARRSATRANNHSTEMFEGRLIATYSFPATTAAGADVAVCWINVDSVNLKKSASRLESAPNRSRSSASVPSAASRPWLTTATRSQSFSA